MLAQDMCIIAFRSVLFFFFKQKTAYEMRISDWSSDVCSSDLATGLNGAEVTVSAKARNVIASAGGVTETVGGSNAVTSGTVTTTTVRNDVTRGGGSANVTVGGDGDVALVSANGIGGASATMDGAVAGNVNASSKGTSTTNTDKIGSA